MSRIIRAKIKELGASAVAALAHRDDTRQLVFNALRLRRPEIMTLRDIDEVRFLAYIFERIETSKSQILQDLWVGFELAEKRGGFFVEFGATNGLTNSNTWLLENHFGWSGILAEPNAVWHAELSRNRRCVIDRRCVYSESGQTVSFVSPDDPELSAISVTGGRDHFAGVRQAAATFDVETISLNDLLDEYHAPDVIDYMSVDTEGSEFEILEGFDFTKRHIRLLSVEHNNTPQEAKIDQLLTKHNFRRRFPEFSQWDGWYTCDV
jgi:FkbM family methyltransferase